MNELQTPGWLAKRSDESRRVEDVLRAKGFERVDAYRYNSASIRLRVIDSKFEGKTAEERAAMVEAALESLPERTQADIMTILNFSPSEISDMQWASKDYLKNTEFEQPSPSLL